MATKWNWLLTALSIVGLFAAVSVPVYSNLEYAPQVSELKLTELSPEEQTSGALNALVELPGGSPINHTRVLSPEPLETYPTLQDEISPIFELFVEGNTLSVRISMQKSSALSCSAEQVSTTRRRQPDGSVHTLRHILLSCTQTKDGKQITWQQQLELDLAANTADPMPCTRHDATADERVVQDYQSGAPNSLPEKHQGAAIPRRFSMLVHAIAAIDSPELAAETPDLVAFTWQLVSMAPELNKPWPATWGEYEATAQAAAAALAPTLVYLQENNCFDNGDLAAFINSPAFGIVFGERFIVPSRERVQDQPIEFITLPAPHADEP